MWIVCSMLLSVILCVCCIFFFFFFKQKTAYEMRISDWSSDVCSSDLLIRHPDNRPALVLNADYTPLSYYPLSVWPWQTAIKTVFLERVDKIGRASCRERVCQYV